MLDPGHTSHLNKELPAPGHSLLPDQGVDWLFLLLGLLYLYEPGDGIDGLGWLRHFFRLHLEKEKCCNKYFSGFRN